MKESFARATLKRHASFEAFLETLSSTRRKSLRQKRRRLEKLGEVKIEVHRNLTRAPDLAARFMRLDALTWKGDEGTALSQTLADRAYFEAITREAAARDGLLFVELKVGERLAAMAANFTLGRTLFAFKIAYDPALKDYSPGIQVEMATVRAFHDEPRLEVADGGTSGPSYLDACWGQARLMQHVQVSTGRPRSRLHVEATMRLTHAKRALRHALDRSRTAIDAARSARGLTSRVVLPR